MGGLHLIPAGTGEGRLYASTELPDVPVGTSREMKLHIHNVGDQALTISLPINLSGPQSSSFSVTQQPDASIAPGQSSPLTITFSPVAAGDREAVVKITNNDPEEGNFLFIASGTGVTSVLYPLPDLVVTELTPPVQKCNKKGLCSLSGTIQISSTSNIPFTGGLYYVSRMEAKGFYDRNSDPVASGVVKKLKPWGGDPNFPAVKTFKYKIKGLTAQDLRFGLLVVPSAGGYDPDYTNNWVLIDIP